MVQLNQLIKWWILPLTVLAGAMFFLSLEAFASPIHIFGFRLGSLHLVYTVILIYSLDLFLGIGSYSRFLTLGILVGGSTQAIGSYLSTGGETISSNTLFPPLLILFISGIVAILSLIGAIGKGWTKLPVWPIASVPWRWAGAIIILLIFIIFRISQVFLRALEVANELRSLIVGTVELHHLISGMMLLIFLIPLSHSLLIKIGNSSICRFILIVALGFLADQASYLALSEINDETYFSSTSFIGGMLATIGSMAWLLFRPTSMYQLGERE